jgi:alpha-beta hydrolase superfamily lysophospholipase
VETSHAACRRFRASDGYDFFFSEAGPQTGREPRGSLVFLHGIQSHAGWYGWSRRKLAEAGWHLVMPDRRGSGRNETERGHAPSAARLIGDVAELTEAHARRPTVLIAVSWGAKLGTILAAERPDLFDGLALLYPGLRTQLTIPLAKRWAIRAAVDGGLDRLRVRLPLDDPALFTDQPAARRRIAADPLAVRKVTLAFLSATLELDRRLPVLLPRLTLPTLMMLAGRDRIVDNRRTRQLFDTIPASEKVLHEFGQARHTFEFEPDREEILAVLLAWLETLPPARSEQEE